ncbi:hypothetical protein AOG2_34240 [Geobacter sp. AOG2]|nr:hypothetical protein AOG2_34240 [Geobacter sp. AOG2]
MVAVHVTGRMCGIKTRHVRGVGKSRQREAVKFDISAIYGEPFGIGDDMLARVFTRAPDSGAGNRSPPKNSCDNFI